MNRLSAEPWVTNREDLSPPKTLRTTLILVAWAGTLLLSRLPQIVLSQLGVVTPSDWSLWWWILIGVALITLTYLWSAIRPLRSYFLVLTLIYLITVGLDLLNQTSLWVSWFGQQRSWLTGFFGERLGVVLMALVLAGILSLFGKRRRDYYLAIGNLKAPVEGLRFPLDKPIPWGIAGPLIALLLAGLVTAGMLTMNPISLTSVTALQLLPSVLLFALMNAFGEEMFYRAGPLSQLMHDVGKGQAVWITALWFGLGHYYGGVSFGALGVVYLTLVAALFGKAMVETKGLALPVFMHLLGDVVLYIVLIQGSV